MPIEDIIDAMSDTKNPVERIALWMQLQNHPELRKLNERLQSRNKSSVDYHVTILALTKMDTFIEMMDDVIFIWDLYSTEIPF